MALIDHDYWDFTAHVITSDIVRGTAVEFVPRTDGNSIPWVQIASADNDVFDDDARTTYVGVALTSGVVGAQIACRAWAAGTMPALVNTATDIEAGTDLYWDGSSFVILDPNVTTATIDSVSDNGPDIREGHYS